ncbi:MAG: selenobiotic family radical SAM modification target peptide, partial [Desulfobacter sp.]|nr:selenobiotic family radical SAM modification target peptide [Desulfobacter sp.]
CIAGLLTGSTATLSGCTNGSG